MSYRKNHEEHIPHLERFGPNWTDKVSFFKEFLAEQEFSGSRSRFRILTRWFYASCELHRGGGCPILEKAENFQLKCGTWETKRCDELPHIPYLNLKNSFFLTAE